MNPQKILLVFSTVVLFFLQSCAIRSGGPVGGEQDTTPPKVRSEKPANKSTNFNSDKIVITFDEYIELTNQSREITITPALPQNPEIYLTRKNVVINTGKAELQPNTTYVIQFGQSIRDINEGNVLRDYRYIFSTGSYIDSLYLGGNVLAANTGKAPENVRINLYKADAPDSAIYKVRPSYFASADASGNFSLENLPKGEYKIYALADANQNYLLDGDELVGFYHSNITIDTSVTLTQPILLFPSKAGAITLKNAYIDNRKNAFNFSQSIDSLSVNGQLISDSTKFTFIGEKRDSFIVYNIPAQRFTGNTIKISARNDVSRIDTALTISTLKQDSARLLVDFMHEISAANEFKSPVVLRANYPIKTINKANIILLEDSVAVKNITTRFTDSSYTLIALDHAFDEEKKYRVLLKLAALQSYFNQSSDSVKKNIELPLRKNFGLLEALVGLPADGSTYLVELVTGSGTSVYNQTLTQSTRISIPYISAGTYKLRLIKDVNRNGRWDTGNVIQKKLPEEIIYYPEDLNIKANWEMVDVVFDISKRK